MGDSEEAAPKLVDRMALLSVAMKAAVGYTQLNRPTSENLSVGDALEKPKGSLLIAWH